MKRASGRSGCWRTHRALRPHRQPMAPLDEISGAFSQLENEEDGVGKIVIAFPE